MPLREDDERRRALAPLFRGYLHQDYRLEYASAVDAARAFLSEATEEERGRAASALAEVVDRGRLMSFAAVRAALVDLGLGWRPPNRRALLSLLKVLEDGNAH